MRIGIALLISMFCKQAGAQPETPAPILVLDSGGHTAIVRKVLFTPDGRELISVSDDKTIRFWDVASGEPIRVIRPPIGDPYQGKLYAAAAEPGWSMACGRRMGSQKRIRNDLPDRYADRTDHERSHGTFEYRAIPLLRNGSGPESPPRFGIW